MCNWIPHVYPFNLCGFTWHSAADVTKHFEGILNLCTLTCEHVKLWNLRMLLPLSGADNNDQGRKEGGNVSVWRYINERTESWKSDWAPWVWGNCPVCSALPLHSIIAVDGPWPVEKRDRDRERDVRAKYKGTGTILWKEYASELHSEAKI